MSDDAFLPVPSRVRDDIISRAAIDHLMTDLYFGKLFLTATMDGRGAIDMRRELFLKSIVTSNAIQATLK